MLLEPSDRTEQTSSKYAKASRNELCNQDHKTKNSKQGDKFHKLRCLVEVILTLDEILGLLVEGRRQLDQLEHRRQ